MPQQPSALSLCRAVAWAAVLSAQAGLVAIAAPAGVLHVQELQIVDRRGFEKPLVAQSMLLPARWRHDSEVKWSVPTPPCGVLVQVLLQAQSPDGQSAIALTPHERWSKTPLIGGDGCRQASFSSAEQYLRDWVQRQRPAAQWLDYRVRPERSQPARTLGDANFNIRMSTETGQALIGYTLNGKPVRESLLVTVNLAVSHTTDLAGQRSSALHGNATGVLAWRAPEGQLDFGHFDAIWGAIAPGYEWSVRLKQGQDQMQADNFRTQGQINQIQAQIGMDTLRHMIQRGEDKRLTREQIQASWNASVAARDSADDRMHRERIRATRQVEHYVDPSRPSGVAELPNHFRHAWSLKDGHYALTNDPNFNPSRDLGTEGRLLRLAPR